MPKLSDSFCYFVFQNFGGGGGNNGTHLPTNSANAAGPAAAAETGALLANKVRVGRNLKKKSYVILIQFQPQESQVRANGNGNSVEVETKLSGAANLNSLDTNV